MLRSLGEHANESQVGRLILRPLSGYEDDADRERGLESILGAILTVCENHAEVSRHEDHWVVYVEFDDSYILRRSTITWLAQMVIKHRWSLIAGAHDQGWRQELSSRRSIGNTVKRCAQ